MCLCVCVAKPVAVELRCHATALISYFYSVCLAFRFITFSNISVHFNMMRIYASIRNGLDAC